MSADGAFSLADSLSDPLLLTFVLMAFAVGLCIGSFLNVCIARWPLDLSVVKPRSRCPRCGRQIRWYENIPVVSWIALRAKCPGCGLPISAIYPGVELLVGIGWALAIAAFGPTLPGLNVAVFGTVLLGIAVTDYQHYLIPDGFTVFGFLWMLAMSVAALLIGDLGPFASPGDALIGACAGAGAIAIAGWLGEVALKREAMGFGDVTLMAMVGAALGPWRTLLTIFVGAALALVGVLLVFAPLARIRSTHDGAQLRLPFASRESGLPLVPFGVFLAPAALLTLLWGTELVAWYKQLVGITP
jgi:leader peptidase (prepilin peptidase) / N-methyltransferase